MLHNLKYWKMQNVHILHFYFVGQNGAQVCVALKTPFSHLPGHSQDPHLSIFQFSTQLQVFLLNRGHPL